MIPAWYLTRLAHAHKRWRDGVISRRELYALVDDVFDYLHELDVAAGLRA